MYTLNSTPKLLKTELLRAGKKRLAYFYGVSAFWTMNYFCLIELHCITGSFFPGFTIFFSIDMLKKLILYTMVLSFII